MANLTNSQPYPGTEYYTLDTTADLNVGDASATTVGSILVQTLGSGWTGTIAPKGRLMGAAGASVGWIALAYQNLNTGADVAAGTNITADGLYAIRADVGMELQLSYTHTAGSVKVLVRRGMG